MENWFNQKESIDNGTLRYPFQPSTRLQMIAVDDIGALVTLAFERRGHWLGRTMEIAGDEHPMTHIANFFSRVSPHEVKYEQLRWDDFERQAGHDLTLLFQWLENSGHRVDIQGVIAEYPNVTTFERWLNLHWHSVRVPVEQQA